MQPEDLVTINLRARMRLHLLDVSFSLGNELVSILGRQGSGKTEILRAIAGVYDPNHGSIAIQHRQVFNPALTINVPPADRHAGWVPHISALFQSKSVFQNIAFPLQKIGIMSPSSLHQRVHEILNLLRLEQVADWELSDLNIQDQYKVATARALVGDPEILLLDELYVDLDVATQRAIRRDFKQLRAMIGVPALVATTDLEEAYDIADRIALLHEGRLLQYDSPKMLVTRPASREVADLVRSVNVFPGTVLETHDDGASVTTAIGTLHVTGRYSGSAEVEVVIRPEHIQVLSAADQSPDNENVLYGQIIEDTNYGPLHSLTFHPDGARPGEVIEIAMSDLLFQQLNLSDLGQRTIVLPSHAVHLMDSHSSSSAM